VEPDFDDLYDVTDDEAFEAPLKASNSVKRTSDMEVRSRYPSIVIPSPSAWPTIEKFQKSATSPFPTTPLAAPSPSVMSMLAAHNLQVPGSSAAPSLDGSMTSEELERISCPPTPDIHHGEENENDWLPPAQLDAAALETLHHISGDGEEPVTQVIEAAPAEMQQVVSPTPRRNTIALTIPTPVESHTDEDTLSALSIPSPGGFFSSLGGSARQTWCMPSSQQDDNVPSTSTAEHFYGVPWSSEPNNLVEQVVEVPTKNDADPDAARLIFSPDGVEVLEIQPSSITYEYDENYEDQLKKVAANSLDRTGMWLNAQETYLSALCETLPIEESEAEASSVHTCKTSNGSSDSVFSPSKKSVRFLDEAIEEANEVLVEEESEKEPMFLEGFQFLRQQSSKLDAFVHRNTRNEALHLQRRCLKEGHHGHLTGKLELTSPIQVSSSRPISNFLPKLDESNEKAKIANAQRERQTLDLIKPASWVLEASKLLNGGSLLSKATSKHLRRTRDGSARVLDVGGQATCDWAWQVALDFPQATVYTVNTAKNATSSDIEAPGNHRQHTVPNMWTFPFPSNHFDVISVRTLYSLLRVYKPAGKKADEYDLCLKECMRCLKPGGFLEFSLMDADVINGGPQASALSVEFGFNLHTRGYDAQPTKTFVPRLRRAGFVDTKRAHIILPMGQTAMKWNDVINAEKNISVEGEVSVSGTTRDAAAMTGLVGAWEWEKWLVHFRRESGWEPSRACEGVVSVLEEGARSDSRSGWRWLSGVARKPF